MQNCSSLALEMNEIALEVSDNTSDDAKVLEACKNGDVDVLKIVLTKTNANAQETEGSRSCALHFAAGFGRLEVVKYLLEFGADVHRRDVGGFIPLHNASMFGHVDVVRLLVEHESDVNAVDNWGYTPLHEAAGKGKADVCLFLLRHGAKYDMKNADGKTAVDVAIHGVKFVLSGEYQYENMFRAAHLGHAMRISEIATPLNVNSVAGKQKMSPLHIAASRCHTAAMNTLLINGADIDSRDNQGATPLFYACRNNHFDAVNMLIKRKADVNASDKRGFTLLHEAVVKSSVRLCSLFLSRGANPTVANKSGQSAIDLSPNQQIQDLLVYEFKGHCLLKAVARCDLAWLKKYLTSDTVNFQHPINGETPLHAAVASTELNRKEVTEFLIFSGSDLQLQNRRCSTPLHVAATMGHHDVMLVLLEHGARVDATDKYQHSPLRYSVDLSDGEACKILMQYGANPHQTSQFGSSFEVASKKIKAILSETGPVKNSMSFQFFEACVKGSVGCAKGILEDFPELLKMRDVFEKSSTSLHLAVRFNKVSVVEMLLWHHAEINAKDSSGRTPLHCSCANGHYESAELLIKHGADLNTSDMTSSTPLHEAALKGFANIVRLLLLSGVDHKKTNKLNKTPLDLVVGIHEDIAAMLRVDDIKKECLKREWSKEKKWNSLPSFKPLPNLSTQCQSTAVPPPLPPPPPSELVNLPSSLTGLNCPPPTLFSPRPPQPIPFAPLPPPQPNLFPLRPPRPNPFSPLQTQQPPLPLFPTPVNLFQPPLSNMLASLQQLPSSLLDRLATSAASVCQPISPAMFASPQTAVTAPLAVNPCVQIPPLMSMLSRLQPPPVQPTVSTVSENGDILKRKFTSFGESCMPPKNKKKKNTSRLIPGTQSYIKDQLRNDKRLEKKYGIPARSLENLIAEINQQDSD